MLAHDHQAIGKPRYLFQHHALIWIWIPQNSVQRCYNRHLQFAQQGQDVAARRPAVDAIFMLNADQIVAVEIKEFRGPFVGAQILLLQLQTHLLWILVA